MKSLCIARQSLIFMFFSVFTIQIEEEHFLQAYLVLLTRSCLEGITRSQIAKHTFCLHVCKYLKTVEFQLVSRFGNWSRLQDYFLEALTSTKVPCIIQCKALFTTLYPRYMSFSLNLFLTMKYSEQDLHFIAVSGIATISVDYLLCRYLSAQ